MEKLNYSLTINATTMDISAEETILQCAYKNGIKLKYYCAAGSCGCCKVKLLSGKVNLQHSGGISRTDITRGLILTCCAFPEGDVVIAMED